MYALYDYKVLIKDYKYLNILYSFSKSVGYVKIK